VSLFSPTNPFLICFESKNRADNPPSLLLCRIKARILRYAKTNHIFHEPEPGKVSHTALSAHLALSPSTAAF
jgi:hypothetical protein